MGQAEVKRNGNEITLQKIWTIVLIVNVVLGVFVGYYFLKNIQPYAAAQNDMKIEVEKLKVWKDNHDCVTTDMRQAIKACPTKTEIEPEFRGINDKIDALKTSQDMTNGKIDEIHKWIMQQNRTRPE